MTLGSFSFRHIYVYIIDLCFVCTPSIIMPFKIRFRDKKIKGSKLEGIREESAQYPT